MEPRPRLVLASQSPRRRELLLQLGFDLEVKPARADESTRPGEDPRAYVERVARAKARVVGAGAGEFVLAADTSVVLEGEVLGKPADPAEAARMLRALSGRTHEVLTGVVVLCGQAPDSPPQEAAAVVATAVTFAAMRETEITWYVSTGEPFDKAGAYAIQGAGGAFVCSIAGSVSNVVGLPLAETLALLRQAGFPLPWERGT